MKIKSRKLEKGEKSWHVLDRFALDRLAQFFQMNPVLDRSKTGKLL